MRATTYIPQEKEEQTALMKWAVLSAGRRPELRLIYHIPNGGSRNAIEARNLKAQGVKAGVPDICLPVARKGYHGLYIELKRQQGGRVSEAQDGWIKALNEQGYLAKVCAGFMEAVRLIEDYLGELKGEET